MFQHLYFTKGVWFDYLSALFNRSCPFVQFIFMCIITLVSVCHICSSFFWHINSINYLSSIVNFQWHWCLLDCYNSHCALKPPWIVMSHQNFLQNVGIRCQWQWWSVMVPDGIIVLIKLHWQLFWHYGGSVLCDGDVMYNVNGLLLCLQLTES